MDILAGVEWEDDRFSLAGYTFLLQHQRSQNTSADGFVFYKTREQLKQYQHLFAHLDRAPRTILELGIWDGGSAAFWTEVLQPDTYIAVDAQLRGDSDYFRRWNAERGRGRVTTHWGVAQDDPAAINTALGAERLDLVIDDCSHQFAETLRSFELLFPRLAPGGHYVIEDWAWSLQPEFQVIDHPWATRPALHPIAHLLTDLHGSRSDLIAMLWIYPDAIVAKRGPAPCEHLDVRSDIARRPRPYVRLVGEATRRQLGRLRRAATGRSNGQGSGG